MCFRGLKCCLDKNRNFDHVMPNSTGSRKKLLVLEVEPFNQPVFIQDENSDTRPLYQEMEFKIEFLTPRSLTVQTPHFNQGFFLRDFNDFSMLVFASLPFFHQVKKILQQFLHQLFYIIFFFNKKFNLIAKLSVKKEQILV